MYKLGFSSTNGRWLMMAGNLNSPVYSINGNAAAELYRTLQVEICCRLQTVTCCKQQPTAGIMSYTLRLHPVAAVHKPCYLAGSVPSTLAASRHLPVIWGGVSSFVAESEPHLSFRYTFESFCAQATLSFFLFFPHPGARA